MFSITFLYFLNTSLTFYLQVTWVRIEPEVTLLTLQTNTIVKDNRIHVTHNNFKEWTLHIDNVQESDRGLYMCQINTNPMLSQYGHLDVLGTHLCIQHINFKFYKALMFKTKSLKKECN